MRLSAGIPIVFAAVFATPALATDWTVGPLGSGAQFTTIQSAVSVAQPGDRVRVMAGAYSGTVLIAHGIEVLGVGSSVTMISTPAGPGGVVIPPVRIANLPAGSRCRFAGFSIAASGTVDVPQTYLLQIDQCAGRVELNDIVLTGSSLPYLQSASVGGTVYVSNAAQVVASGIHAFGSQLGPPTPGRVTPIKGVPGMLIQQSSVFVADSFVDGCATFVPATGFGGDGGDGISVFGSNVQISRSSIRGAQSGGNSVSIAALGGAGVRASGSVVVIHGGTFNSVRGADVFESSLGPNSWSGLANSAVRLDAASTLAYASDVALVGGAGSLSLPPAPATWWVPGAMIYALAERLPTVSLTPASIAIGTTLTVELSGQPGLDHIRAVTLQTAYGVALPGAFGTLLVDLPTVAAIEIVNLGASGTATVLVPIPPDPSLTGLQIVEQGAQSLSFGIMLAPPALCSLVP